METFWQDVRFAARMLAKSPGFTAVAVLTLALGIGANTAIFSVVDAILLRRLPVDAPEHLVVIHNQLPKVNLPRTEISALQFRDYADRTDVFESAAAITFRNYNLTGTDQPQRLLGMRVSASLFPLLGVHPVAGRVFTAAEDAYGAQHVVVLRSEEHTSELQSRLHLVCRLLLEKKKKKEKKKIYETLNI